MKKSVCSGIVILCASLIIPSVSYGYTIENLGNLGLMVSAQDINNNNEVVGISMDSGGVMHAVKWDATSGLTTIVSDADSRAYGINDSGQVALRIGNDGYRWTSGGGKETLSGTSNIAVRGITSSGGIYGVHGASATYWDSPTTSTSYSLSIGRYGDMTSAYSDSGYKVGYSFLLSGSTVYGEQAVLWTSSLTYNNLTNLATGQESSAQSINSSNQIVGWAEDSDNVQHAVLWDDYLSSPFALGTGVAKEISSDGTKIVGLHDDQAVVWVYETDSWIMYYLNDFLEPASGWDLKIATGINDNNMIIGDGLLNGQYRAFIFDFNESAAVPEPLSIITVLLGIAALKFKRNK